MNFISVFLFIVKVIILEIIVDILKPPLISAMPAALNRNCAHIPGKYAISWLVDGLESAVIAGLLYLEYHLVIVVAVTLASSFLATAAIRNIFSLK